MTEIILTLSALLLGLFCLIYITTQRRELYFPLPKGPLAVLKDRHAVYLGLLCAQILYAAAGLIALLGRRWGMGAAAAGWDTACSVTRILFFVFLALYAVSILLWDGTRYVNRGARLIALLPVAVAVIGAALQTVFHVDVELFFAGMTLLACLVLPEDQTMSRRLRTGIALAVGLALVAVILTNISLILQMSNAQSEALGNTQLEVIGGDLEDTITKAETEVQLVAFDAEKLMAGGATRQALSQHFDALREKYLAGDESFMNVYIAGKDWHIVPGFDAPADFHASERLWYLGAQDAPGRVYITEPYLDADTGEMCFTVSVMLSDGETVVGMDLNFSKAQESIVEMTRGRAQNAMIVTSGGVIAGYTDMSLVGQKAEEKLPEYADILRRVFASQQHNSFRVELEGHPCMVFSSETGNHWYLILTVDISDLYGESYRQMALMASVNLLMLAAVALFYVRSVRKNRLADEALADNRGRLHHFSGRIRQEAAHLMRLGDVRLVREGDDPAALLGQVRDSGQELSDMAGEMVSYAQVLRNNDEEGGTNAVQSMEAPSRKVRNGIIVSLLISLVIVMGFCIRISVNWGTARMEREADTYENQLTQWLTQQQSILYMFTDMITSQPQLLEDYDAAVRWLGDVAGHYPEISLCYMANPYADHPVIMSNGWEPGEDYRPETRPWYRATERSATGFSVSEPYLDAQSGNYCITLSRVVNGRNGEFLGIFGIDFFLDKLVMVLGESYTSQSYAFLVDAQGVIINHPNEAYQMGEDTGTRVEDTEYVETYHRSGVTTSRDYSGRLMACLSRSTESGFTVVVANRWWSIYGSVVVVSLIFLALFAVCFAFIVSLIARLIRWQAQANRRLMDAVDEAQRANRAKSQFLSQMSHEIRTPMNAIIGLDNIALRDDTISGQTRSSLEKIGASARHLLSLINDILDMSRIESGRMELKNQSFSFRELLEQINVIIGGQCQDKGLQFVTHIAPDMDGTFVGDDLKLKQVLINILGNAVKFTDAPGVITFTAAQTETADDSAVLRFTVEDTGIGMDPEFIPRLFNAFSQEDTGTTNRFGGSGLGMAITKSMVEMMGGAIAVESEKGLGSTFTVTVPLGRTAEEQPHDAPAIQPDGEIVPVAGRHVLIAEDQEMNAEVLMDLLELEDVTSEWADNGEKAVAAFAQSAPGHFDAVLMDMRMPVMDGLAATEAIRALDRPDAKTVPIVALTANAFEEDVKQCLAAGMNAHLSKPVDVELLKTTLGRLLAEK